MATCFMQFIACRHVRVKSPARLLAPPSVVMLKLIGDSDTAPASRGFAHFLGTPSPLGADRAQIAASDYDSLAAERRLLWEVLRVTVDDLSLASRAYITRDQLVDYKGARRDALLPGGLWYCSMIGLNPETVRKRLRFFGYLPPVKYYEPRLLRFDHLPHLCAVVGQYRDRYVADHADVDQSSKAEVERQLESINQKGLKHGIFTRSVN